jgi:hypothetical protein
MKIKKFESFTESINEDLTYDTPSQYISMALKKLQSKINKMFDYEPEKTGEAGEPFKSPKKEGEEDKITFKDLMVDIDNSEISKYSKLNDSLTITFSDSDFMYKLIILINIKEGIPEDKEKDFSFKDVNNCFLKLKKYDINTYEIIGEISKNVKISKIDEEFLINLKIELDEDFSEDEEFEIETE